MPKPEGLPFPTVSGPKFVCRYVDSGTAHWDKRQKLSPNGVLSFQDNRALFLFTAEKDWDPRPKRWLSIPLAQLEVTFYEPGKHFAEIVCRRPMQYDQYHSFHLVAEEESRLEELQKVLLENLK